MISRRLFSSFGIFSGLLVTALVFIATPALAESSGGSLRYSVFVEKFENKTDQPRLGDEWATELTSALQESGRFIVVAQEDMQHSAFKEQARATSGVTAQGRKTAQKARMTPAQLLVKGVITDFKQGAAGQESGIGIGGIRLGGGRARTEISATIQMIDATTGTVVVSRRFTGIAQNRAFTLGYAGKDRNGALKAGESDNVHAALEKAIDDVIPWMTGQLSNVPWRGSVLKTEGDKVYINRGSREGVSAGDEFIVGESEHLMDPDTGEELDELVRERARLRVLQVQERTSVCSVISGNPGLVITGMGVRPGREKS